MPQIEIEIDTQYLSAQSEPEQKQYVFAYTITIRNLSEEKVQLLKRAWEIVDANQKTTRIAGDGVVGQQPEIKAGESFSYTSGTVLLTPLGSMGGFYTFADAAGTSFDVAIPTFRLAVPNILH